MRSLLPGSRSARIDTYSILSPTLFLFCCLMIRRPPRSPPFPYPTLFRSVDVLRAAPAPADRLRRGLHRRVQLHQRSAEHTAELQSHSFISYALFFLKN